MPRVTRRPTAEQMWIAGLFDSCSRGGYNRVITKRAMLVNGRLPTGPGATAGSVRVTEQQQACVTGRETREPVGQAQAQL